jgi:hypothetical protein
MKQYTGSVSLHSNILNLFWLNKYFCDLGLVGIVTLRLLPTGYSAGTKQGQAILCNPANVIP